MNLDTFISKSVISDMEFSSVYIFPNIPQKKLSNAISEYAPNVSMSDVVVLFDETLWGSAKEGILITNQKLILSKKFGKREIPIEKIETIDTNDKTLIINGMPIPEFTYPDAIPLKCLVSTINDFISARIKKINNDADADIIDDTTTSRMKNFLSLVSTPIYQDNIKDSDKKPDETVNGYVLGNNVTKEQEELIRFKADLSSNESILSVSWLDIHGHRDEFFCITNSGLYSVITHNSVVYIPFESLKSEEIIEEFKKGRHIAVKFANGEEIKVSNQNYKFKPYAYQLIQGVIDLLNDKKPEFEVTNNSQIKPEKTDSIKADDERSALKSIKTTDFFIANKHLIIDSVRKEYNSDSYCNFVDKTISLALTIKTKKAVEEHIKDYNSKCLDKMLFESELATYISICWCSILTSHLLSSNDFEDSIIKKICSGFGMPILLYGAEKEKETLNTLKSLANPLKSIGDTIYFKKYLEFYGVGIRSLANNDDREQAVGFFLHNTILSSLHVSDDDDDEYSINDIRFNKGFGVELKELEKEFEYKDIMAFYEYVNDFLLTLESQVESNLITLLRS